MLAALAAAIPSSLESIFNSAATLFTMDFVQHFKPNLSESGLVRTGKAKHANQLWYLQKIETLSLGNNKGIWMQKTV